MPTFINQATLSYNDRVTNSNVVTGELIDVLSATKTAVSGTYGAGDTVTYIVSIVNSGTTAFTGLTVTDNLGAYEIGDPPVTVVPLSFVAGTLRYFVNGVLQAAPTVSAENPLTITGITVPAGGNVQLIYDALVGAGAPLATGGSITNTATVTGGGLAVPVTADAVVEAVSEADLTISKAICPATVTENGTLAYTFVIQNTGNTPAVEGDNLTVSDTFDPILSDLTVTLDGVTLTEGTDYTYNTATGEFVTVPGRITVPAASFVQDPATGIYAVTPGVAVLRVTGTV